MRYFFRRRSREQGQESPAQVEEGVEEQEQEYVEPVLDESEAQQLEEGREATAEVRHCLSSATVIPSAFMFGVPLFCPLIVDCAPSPLTVPLGQAGCCEGAK